MTPVLPVTHLQVNLPIRLKDTSMPSANNEMASANNEMASVNNEIASSNNESASAKAPPACMSHLPNEILEDICKNTPTKDLANLAKTSALMYSNALPILLKRNAQEGNSSALKQAVLGACSSRASERNWGYMLIRQCLKYGADLNAQHPCTHGHFTVLSIALMVGNYRLAKMLLRSGADPCTPFICSRPSHRPSFLSWDSLRRNNFSRGIIAQSLLKCTMFTPLTIPLVQNQWKFVDLLLQYNASEDIAVFSPITSSVPVHSITVHHICAASDIMGLGQAFIDRFPESTNRQIRRVGPRPLIIAMEMENVDMFDKLLSAGVDTNALSGVTQISPLHYAVKKCCSARSRESRRNYHEFATKLIKAGADVDGPPVFHSTMTPLMSLLEAEEYNWGQAYHDLQPLLYELLEAGANVNFLTNSGETPCHVLVEKIARRGRDCWSHSLVRLLETLVMDHDASLNLGLAPDPSILGRCLDTVLEKSNPAMSRRLVKKVVSLGAVLRADEVGQYFVPWIRDPQLQKLYDLPLHNKQHVPSSLMGGAYRVSIKRKDVKQFNLLQRFRQPFRPDGMLCLALLPENYEPKIVGQALSWTWEPNFVFRASGDDPGGSYIHRILQLLRNRPKIREEQALDYARRFVRMGTSVLLNNEMGRCAVQELNKVVSENRKPYHRLKAFLVERQSAELSGEEG